MPKRQYYRTFPQILKLATLAQRGNADSKQRLIISHQFFKIHKAKWTMKNSKIPPNSFQQQNKGSITTGAKTGHHFPPKLCVAHRLSPMQECVHATQIACMFENMSKWGNHTFFFQKSPQVFQGEAHTLCKIDESNNNVGRATVFDTKKRCNE